MNRNLTLDIVRTNAIVLMVIFHFIYDLKFFGFVSWDIPDGMAWRQFRWLIISLFFLCLGISLTFAHSKGIGFKKFITRVMQISLAALIISIATYFAIPENWIFFGVLHFLAIASCIVIWFVRKPLLSLTFGIVLMTIGAFQLVPTRWPFHLIFDGLPKYTNDYVAIIPWLGMVLIGVSIAHSQWFINDPIGKFYVNKQGKTLRVIIWPGQHSLTIYLLHQPIMMGIIYLITLI